MRSVYRAGLAAAFCFGIGCFGIGCDGPVALPDGSISSDGGLLDGGGEGLPPIETDADRDAPGMPLEFRSRADLADLLPSSSRPTFELVRDASAYEALFGTAPPSDVDFDAAWLAVYRPGETARAADRATVARMRLRGNRLDVTTSLQMPSEGCASAIDLRRSASVVILEHAFIVDRVDEVRFLRRDRAIDCAGLSAIEIAVDEVESFVSFFEDSRGSQRDLPVDTVRLSAEAVALTLDEEELAHGTVRGLRHVLLGFPVGHAGLFETTGASAMPYQGTSRVGACLRPYEDGFVVTYVDATPTLPLDPGDRIIGINNERGDAMYRTALARPVSASGSATEGSARLLAANATFATLPLGSELQVLSPDGLPRVVRFDDDRFPRAINCVDAFARDYYFDARASIRPDGIAVVRLPTFYPRAAGPPGETIDGLIARMRASVLAALDTVRDAEGIVWDARNNFGGISLIGLEIVGGMPSARSTAIATCEYRTAANTYVTDPSIDYRVTPGGPLLFEGPAAVVIDGLAVSASDYFALAVRSASDTPLVGTEAAGGFGTAYPTKDLAFPVPLSASSDSYRCLGADGEPLESHATAPTHFVEQDPGDLSRGIDTQLETAVALVLEQL